MLAVSQERVVLVDHLQRGVPKNIRAVQLEHALSLKGIRTDYLDSSGLLRRGPELQLPLQVAPGYVLLLRNGGVELDFARNCVLLSKSNFEHAAVGSAHVNLKLGAVGGDGGGHKSLLLEVGHARYLEAAHVAEAPHLVEVVACVSVVAHLVQEG